MVKSIEVKPCLLQNYYQHNNIKTINKPVVGSLLCRIKKNSSQTQLQSHSQSSQTNHEDGKEYFVVVDVRPKRRGNNKGITDGIFLESVIDVKNGVATYNETDYAMILTLTNHGDWWNKNLLKEYDFIWDPEVDENPMVTQFKLSSPLRVPSSIDFGSQNSEADGLFSPSSEGSNISQGKQSLYSEGGRIRLHSWQPSSASSKGLSDQSNQPEISPSLGANVGSTELNSHRRHSIGVTEASDNSGTSRVNIITEVKSTPSNPSNIIFESASTGIATINIVEKSAGTSPLPDLKFQGTGHNIT